MNSPWTDEDVQNAGECDQDQVPGHLEPPQDVLRLHDGQHQDDDRAIGDPWCGRATFVRGDDERHRREEENGAQVLLR